MSKTKFRNVISLILVFLTLCLFLFILHKPSGADANAGILNSVEANQIEEVIIKSYEIEAYAANTFDTSAFASVFVNDLRGEKLSESTNAFIKSVNSRETMTNPGYLDYKLAYYNWWKQGALKYEQLKATAVQEGRSMSKDELKSLVDDQGRLAMPRGQILNRKVELRFLSVSINGEIAIVKFDDGPRTNRMTLVKINNEWYIAGNFIEAVHP